MRYASLTLFVVFVMTLGVWSRAAATQPAPRELIINLVRADNGKPLGDAECWYEVNGDEGTKIKIGASGKIKIPLPAGAREMSVSVQKTGFVMMDVAFGKGARPRPWTDHLTLPLRKGITIGGIVRDQDGKPVEGVKVLFEAMDDRPDMPERRVFGGGVAYTDRDGKWSFDGAPQRPLSISIDAQHPDYAVDSSHRDDVVEDFDLLKKKAFITVIHRGLSVAGTIVDEQNHPIANAKLGQDWLGMINGTTSDAQGRFTLRGVEPGFHDFLADAEGFVPAAISMKLAPDHLNPLTFKMQKGREIRGSAVDSQGHPINRAYVSFMPFKDHSHLRPYVLTDAHGNFVWTGAPATPVTVEVSKRGYAVARGLIWTADGSQHNVTLGEVADDPMGRPMLATVRGTVVDEQTGQPIKEFQVTVTIRKNDKPSMSWVFDAEGADGHYQVPLAERGEQYIVRSDSAHYLPLESPILSDGAALQFNARLKHGTPLTGTLRQPDGRPAFHAQVALEEQPGISVNDGRITPYQSRQAHFTVTDEKGHFELPPRQGNVTVFAVHKSGWAEWICDGQGEVESVKLGPWSSLEGTIYEGDQPAIGKRVVMRAMDPSRQELARGWFRYETTTDEHGHFEFLRAADGPLRLTAQDPPGFGAAGERLTAKIELAPGEHQTLQLGGTGRIVIGKLVVPADLLAKTTRPQTGSISAIEPAFIQPAGYDRLRAEEKQKLHEAFRDSPAYRQYLSRPTSYGIHFNHDGSFRADNIPPGQYVIYFGLNGDKPDANNMVPLLGSIRKIVTVREAPDGDNSQPFSLGTFTMTPRPSAEHDFKPGADAPDFIAQTYDGKKVRLSDLHGKFVLINFWATWCGPCIAEMPQLQKLSEKYAGDKRLVMVGISMDDQMQNPARFLKNHPLSWAQWYGGASGTQDAFDAFAIQAIPSLWIISPSGKIVARDVQIGGVQVILEKELAGK